MDAPKVVYLNIGKSGILFASESPQYFDELADNSNTKYIRADLTELTWKDIAMIITTYEQEITNGNITRYGTALDVKPYAQRVLRRFLESKKEG